MNSTRRVLDRLSLIEARFNGSNIVVTKPLIPGSQMAVQVRVDKSLPTVIEPNPPGLVQAFHVQVALFIEVKESASSPEVNLSTTSAVMGIFGVLSGEPLKVESVVASAHSMARLIYPLARSEIARLLANARLFDMPLSWDIGADPEAEEKALTHVQGQT